MCEFLRSIITSQELVANLQMNKYSRWLTRSDTDSLESVLLAVGEFGRRYWAMRTPDGHFPRPVFVNHNMAEFRMVSALYFFAIVRGTGRSDRILKSGWDNEYSTERPAFSQAFRDRLSNNPMTAWAHDIDENTFVGIIWNIGEYGVRVCYGHDPKREIPPPHFDGQDNESEISPMREALVMIAMVESGVNISPEDAARRIADAIV